MVSVGPVRPGRRASRTRRSSRSGERRGEVEVAGLRPRSVSGVTIAPAFVLAAVDAVRVGGEGEDARRAVERQRQAGEELAVPPAAPALALR